jgi:general secretion pathway protein A
MFLIEQYSNGKKVVLIVDEAQNLTRKVLEEIRLMSGIETHKEKVLRIILAGQPELKDTLDSENLRQLTQRVRLRFHIGPLDSREMTEYINHRVAVAGREAGDLFHDDVFDIIHRYTGGVPRLINTLCDTALLCAFADEKHDVNAEDIMSAVAELNWKEHESNTGLYDKLQQVSDRLAANDIANVTQIEVRSDGDRLSVQSFPNGRIIVGRSPDNEIYIKSKFVSRHHAQIVTDDEGCVIEDLNSTNGVFIGERQVKKHRLRNGDIVTLGVHDLVYTDLRKEETGSMEAIKEELPEEDLLEDNDEASVVGE